MGKIYVTDKESKADIKVCEVKDYKADMKYWVTDKEYKAKDDAKWCYVTQEYKADKKIWWTDKEYKADLKVCAVTQEYKAKGKF